jgi:hypothetical protein
VRRQGKKSSIRDRHLPLIVGAIICQNIFFGCATLPIVPFPPGVTPPRTVAVLPLDNRTNSVRGALHLREVLHRNLDRKGYVALPLSNVDQLLSDQFGVSLGGQITDDLIPALGKALEVDAVITGTVLAYGRLGPKEIEAKVALYETRTGRKLWDHYGYGHTEIRTSVDARGHTQVIVTKNPIDEFFGTLFAKMPNGAEPPSGGRFGY